MSPFLTVASTFTGQIAAGLVDYGTQENPGLTPLDLISNGVTDNGYYYLKGTAGAAANTAKLFYCILDSSFSLGGGWAIIANHDADKQPNAAHQARPTGNSSYVGYDNASGNGDVSSEPTAAVMLPNRSFSQNAAAIPFTKMVHAAYGNTNMGSISTDNWLSVKTYYAGSFNSAQTIGTSATWAKTCDSQNITINSFARRLQYTGYTTLAFGVMNDSTGSYPKVNGNGAATQNYPLFIGSHTGDFNSGNGATATFSWCDSSASTSSTNDPHGWDDFQDGSGMGDGWSVENVSANAYRGYPSYILIQ